MKTQLIILEQGNILVSDEEIKEGDTYVVPHNIEGEILSSRLKISIAHKNFMLNYYVKEIKNWYKKLIASDNTEHCLPNIDYSALSNEDCKTIGVDIEIFECILQDRTFFKFWYTDSKGLNQHSGLYLRREDALKGLRDFKINSLEDIKSLVNSVTEFMSPNSPSEFEEWFKKLTKLQQPKIFDVEVEMKNDEFIINKIL